VVGAAAAEYLTGGSLADTINGAGGADTMVGGAGDDLYYVNTPSDTVVEAAGGGTDRVIATASYVLPANTENLTLSGPAAINGTGNGGANRVTGNVVANTLSGLGGNDALLGLAGNDTLLGGAGADQLNGGAGADSMVGGAGNDIYVADNAGDRVVEAANEGNDVVRASVSFTLSDGVERLTLTGSAAINGTGNALANVITGNAGANRLDGGGGNDILNGGAGADTLTGGSGNDVLIGGTGADTLTGGAGTDFFRYAAPAQGSDRITDFDPSRDIIQIMQSGFSQDLAVGRLDPLHFVSGASAVGSGAQFIYDSGSGVLRWDADGAGGQSSVVIATLTGAPALTAADITIIA